MCFLFTEPSPEPQMNQLMQPQAMHTTVFTHPGMVPQQNWSSPSFAMQQPMQPPVQQQYGAPGGQQQQQFTPMGPESYQSQQVQWPP